ncbi:MAG: Rpn family recombination-promoting nuclease/putative transposase [Lachnospiraceae bacterium]|nr:Rpn family recombination-promoting nuclease/putative transposase [Lachnospiraceae bacterium]
MGTPDVVCNTYLENPMRFADVINHGIFGGLPVIDPKKLEAMDSGSSVYGGTKKARDIVKKYYDGKVVIGIIGIEDQTRIHYAMPLKNMWYDLYSYEKQRQDIARYHTKFKDLQGDEWLSKFGKEDKLIPVITLTVYYGTKTWDGPKTLHEMLSIPPGLKRFQPLFCNYHAHLLQITEIQDLESYSDDLKIVFGFVKYQKEKEALLNYVQENKELFQSVSDENYYVIKQLTRSDEIDRYRKNEESEGMNVCKALQDLKEEGREEGRTEGKTQNLAEQIMKKLKKGLDIKTIAEHVEESEAFVQEICNVIRENPEADSKEVFEMFLKKQMQ